MCTQSVMLVQLHMHTHTLTHAHMCSKSMLAQRVVRLNLIHSLTLYTHSPYTHTHTHTHTHTPGFPEFVSYPEFRRLYGALMPQEQGVASMSNKEKAEYILSCAEVEKSTYRLGLSRVFFRAGTLAKLDRQVEESTHDIIVQFQVSRAGQLLVIRQKLKNGSVTTLNIKGCP